MKKWVIFTVLGVMLLFAVVIFSFQDDSYLRFSQTGDTLSSSMPSISAIYK